MPDLAPTPRPDPYRSNHTEASERACAKMAGDEGVKHAAQGDLVNARLWFEKALQFLRHAKCEQSRQLRARLSINVGEICKAGGSTRSYLRYAEKALQEPSAEARVVRRARLQRAEAYFILFQEDGRVDTLKAAIADICQIRKQLQTCPDRLRIEKLMGQLSEAVEQLTSDGILSSE